MAGGCFLFERIGDSTPFIPENIGEEARSLQSAVQKFITGEVLPVSDRIESQDFNLIRGLLKRAGDLGILSAGLPTNFGGLGLDQMSLTAMVENLAWQTSFGVTLIAHSGIGTLPLLYFGTPGLKDKYLPPLVRGEMIGAYCLTEPNAGSDIFAMKSTSVLSPDGKKWRLNGEKCFITNGAIADLLTVFAKVDGAMTAFLVERNTPGVSIGREERKMGIKGSSTTSVFLENVEIPHDHLLGEVGKGHSIALNILNFGRFRLGVACTGIAKWLIGEVVRYAKNRTQFGAPLSDFGAVQNMIADQVIRTFVAESTYYRTAGALDQALKQISDDDPDKLGKTVKVTQEFGVEAAMAKVLGSECLCAVADRAVQILGGYGFVEEYHPARVFRDARINCIFEGTNEINRIQQIALKMLSRSLKEEIPTKAAWKGINEAPSRQNADREGLAGAVEQAGLAKELAIYCYGLVMNDEELLQAVTTVPAARDRGEFIDLALAELTLGAYGIDSTVNRALAIQEQFGSEKARIPATIAQLYANEEYERMISVAKSFVIQATAGNDKRRTEWLNHLRQREGFRPVNIAEAKMKIARQITDREGYHLT